MAVLEKTGLAEKGQKINANTVLPLNKSASGTVGLLLVAILEKKIQ